MRIGLLDHMGYGNLGDAATQEALIANIRTRVPEAEIIGFSLNPSDTRGRHNIDCYSITHWHPGLKKSGQASASGKNPSSRLKAILKNVPVLPSMAAYAGNLVREFVHLGRSFKVLRSLDTLIIAGGGQLCELWRGPWSHPYNVFKFSALTKLANRKLLVLNVGAGPLNSILSRVFVRSSVCLADYVSLRDVQSQTLVHQLGVKRQTHVFPDSVYALDISDYEIRNAVGASRPLVGLNPIGFCDPRIWPRKDVSAYSRYLDNLAAFSQWLLSCNYGLRIFSAELSVDAYALEDLKGRLLSSLSPAEVNEMFVPPSEDVADLVAKMSGCDFVVTSKFHGVVFSHMLTKPVIALSYHNKIDDLMRTVGHSQYCLSIESFDNECLKRAFTALVQDAHELKVKFRQMAGSYSDALKGQFDEVFVPNNLQRQSQGLVTERNGTVFGGSA
jgi:polysaccharide pyruvyl transferase WcaK-like protein